MLLYILDWTFMAISTPPPLALRRSFRYTLYTLLNVSSLSSTQDVNHVSVSMITSGSQEALMHSNSTCLESRLRKLTTKKTKSVQRKICAHSGVVSCLHGELHVVFELK